VTSEQRVQTRVLATQLLNHLEEVCPDFDRVTILPGPRGFICRVFEDATTSEDMRVPVTSLQVTTLDLP